MSGQTRQGRRRSQAKGRVKRKSWVGVVLIEVKETCLRIHCSIKLRILHSAGRIRLHLKLRAAGISEKKKVAPQEAC